MSQKQKLLTVKEASQKANLNQSVIYTILNYDRLECEKIGKHTFIFDDVLEEWIKNNIKQQPSKKSKELDKKEDKKNWDYIPDIKLKYPVILILII